MTQFRSLEEDMPELTRPERLQQLQLDLARLRVQERNATLPPGAAAAHGVDLARDLLWLAEAYRLYGPKEETPPLLTGQQMLDCLTKYRRKPVKVKR